MERLGRQARREAVSISHRERAAKIRTVLATTLVLNWLVAALKLGYGSWSETLSMVADGFHSLLDGSANIIGL
ncbi:MAG: hypothetical protein ACREJ8_12405, partial [Candidatus Methylomirabilales bacterium]